MKMELTSEILGPIEIWRIVNKLRATHQVGAVTILNDNDEPDTVDEQCAIEVVGEWTKYEDRRFYGKTVLDALKKAEAAFDESTKDDPFRKLNPTHDGQVPPRFSADVLAFRAYWKDFENEFIRDLRKRIEEALRHALVVRFGEVPPMKEIAEFGAVQEFGDGLWSRYTFRGVPLVDVEWEKTTVKIHAGPGAFAVPPK